MSEGVDPDLGDIADPVATGEVPVGVVDPVSTAPAVVADGAGAGGDGAAVASAVAGDGSAANADPSTAVTNEADVAAVPAPENAGQEASPAVADPAPSDTNVALNADAAPVDGAGSTEQPSKSESISEQALATQSTQPTLDPDSETSVGAPDGVTASRVVEAGTDPTHPSEAGVDGSAQTTTPEGFRRSESELQQRPPSEGEGRATSVETAADPNAWVIPVTVNGQVIPVEIVPPTERKRWLGGYKHKDTGIEYHNVSTQTFIRLRRPDGKVRFHREAQTKQQSTGSTNDQQTTADSSTQMTGPGVFCSSAQDKIIVPRPYFTAAQWEARREHAAIVIQSNMRRVAATRAVNRVRQMKKEYDAWKLAEAERQQRAEEDEWQSQVQRRLHPKTKADFNLLYSGLEVWRKEQLESLVGLEGDERTEALVALLKQQCSYLSAVEKLKNNAAEEMRDTRIRKFFDTTSRSKRWIEKEYDKVNEMETPATLRARELREVYYGLAFEGLEMDERLDMLLHVKLTVQNHDSKVAREVIGLLSREADLLVRGTREKNLVGLRKRILSLFLRLCEDATFNPAAKHYLPVHKEKEDYLVGNGTGLLKDMATGQYHEADKFLIRDPDHVPTHAAPSRDLLNAGVTRKDTTQYHRILRSIQNVEIERGCGTHGVAFRLIEADMVYLIDTIWGAKSAISQESTLFRLALPRWKQDEEWSPWNCILLDHSETSNHELAADTSLYGEAFCKSITYKHLRARQYFYSVWEAQQKRNAERAQEELASQDDQIQFVKPTLVA